MKRYAIITIITAIALLVFASFAMAAPGEYLLDEGGAPVTGHDTATELEGNVTETVYGTFLDPHSKDEALYLMPDGSPIVNANRTGITGVAGFAGFARNVSGQNVHTDFQINTNSCASCHATHTSQDASGMLLFRSNEYAVCVACHDGSGIPFFNVFTPSATIVADTDYTNSLTLQQRVSGTFGVDFTKGGSIHLPTGDLTLAAAPGGNRLGMDKDGAVVAAWTSEFSCASCHAPHGSYSYRLLNGNPNGIATRTAAEGGLKLVGYTATYAADLSIYGGTGAGYYVYDTLSGTGNNAIRVYPFSRSTAPIIKDNAVDATANFTIDYVNGLFKVNEGYTVTSPVTVDLVKVLKVAIPDGSKVEAEGTEDYEMGDSATVTDANRMVYREGANYNYFCAACHTDYERMLAVRDFNSGGLDQDTGENGSVSRADATGFFSAAMRHSTFRGGNVSLEVIGSAKSSDLLASEAGMLVCVSCHFVHGTDSLIMKTADEAVIGVKGTEDTEGDVNPSSALKRYTNMSVCTKCHISGIGGDSEWFQSNYDTWMNIRNTQYDRIAK